MRIVLKFVLKGPVNDTPALVQLMAWRQSGDKPLSEPMMAWFTNAYMPHRIHYILLILVSADYIHMPQGRFTGIGEILYYTKNLNMIQIESNQNRIYINWVLCYYIPKRNKSIGRMHNLGTVSI